MTDAILVAVSKLLSNSTPVLRPGSYPVNGEVTLRVQGVVTKGEDTEYTPTADIPLIPTLALVLEKSGITRERSIALLTEAMQESLAMGQTAHCALSHRMNDIETAMARVREVTHALPKKTRSGATRVRGEIEILTPLAV